MNKYNIMRILSICLSAHKKICFSSKWDVGGQGEVKAWGQEEEGDKKGTLDDP